MNKHQASPTQWYQQLSVLLSLVEIWFKFSLTISLGKVEFIWVLSLICNLSKIVAIPGSICVISLGLSDNSCGLQKEGFPKSRHEYGNSTHFSITDRNESVLVIGVAPSGPLIALSRLVAYRLLAQSKSGYSVL